MSNKPPFAVVELDEETFKYLVEKNSAAMHFGLAALQMMKGRKKALEQIVSDLENEKKVRAALEGAKK